MCVLSRSSVILVMHCTFLRGSCGPDLYPSILARHSFTSLDSWSLVWEGSILLVGDGAFACSVMSPANQVVVGNVKVDYIVKEDLIKNIVISKKVNIGRAEGPHCLTEYTICKKAAFSTAVIHQVLKSGCRQVP